MHANARYRALFDLDLERDLGGDLSAVLPPDVLVPHITAFSKASREGQSVSFDVSLDGGRRSLTVEIVQMPDDIRDERCLLGVVHDISEHKRIEALLEHRARHDPLTELPNRIMLLETLAESLAYANARTTPRKVGLVLLDLDHFKIVNDSLGLRAGDELFAVVAQRVERILRAGDTVARLGGDELAVVCNDAQDEGDVIAVAERVRAVLAEPFTLATGEVFLTASMGIALSNGEGDVPERMLRDASVAMFAAKRQGRGRIEVFAEPMRENAVARLQMESALRRALVHNEFRVHYQPLVQFESSEVIGFEALLRWQHPERGLVSAEEFLAVAEETGLDRAHRRVRAPRGVRAGRDVGRRVERPRTARGVGEHLRRASSSTTTWSRRCRARSTAPASTRRCCCSRSPSRRSWPTANGRSRCSGSSRRWASGSASTTSAPGSRRSAYLRSLPVHTLKIDGSFIESLGGDPEGGAIVSAVVQLGHALGLSVTAEGVETTDQLSWLRALGCDLGQGFYFAHPQPGAIVRALVHHRFHWRRARRRRLTRYSSSVARQAWSMLQA